MTDFDGLMEELATVQEERDELRDVLAELLNKKKWGVPGGYLDTDSYYDRWDREREEYVQVLSCTYCSCSWWHYEDEQHAADCPVARARALLA